MIFRKYIPKYPLGNYIDCIVNIEGNTIKPSAILQTIKNTGWHGPGCLGNFFTILSFQQLLHLSKLKKYMRSVTSFYLIILAISCLAANHAAAQSNPLNGTWIPVKQEMGGKLFPQSVFTNQKLIISDSMYTVVAESVDKGIMRAHEDKMDIYGKDGVNAGKHFMALYKIENGQLTICYNLAGDSYPEVFETKGKPMFFMSVFQNEIKK
jgi:uncharacterized protein (TIGR03067 family)